MRPVQVLTCIASVRFLLFAMTLPKYTSSIVIETSNREWFYNCASQGLYGDIGDLSTDIREDDVLVRCMVEIAVTSPFSDYDLDMRYHNNGNDWCYPPSILSLRTACRNPLFNRYDVLRTCIFRQGIPPEALPKDSDSVDIAIYYNGVIERMCSLLDGLRTTEGKNCLLQACTSAAELPNEMTTTSNPTFASTRTTMSPTSNTMVPSYGPSLPPTLVPSHRPSLTPSLQPSHTPTSIPSDLPSILPSETPSVQPSFFPSELPSKTPSVQPSFVPSELPSKTPSVQPNSVPSDVPSLVPTAVPPSETPSATPVLTSPPPSTHVPRSDSNEHTIIQVEIFSRLFLSFPSNMTSYAKEYSKRSFWEVLEIAMSEVVSPLVGTAEFEVVSVSNKKNQPLSLVVRMVIQRICYADVCPVGTISDDIIMDYIEELQGSVVSGKLASVISLKASESEQREQLTSLKLVRVEPGSYNLLHFVVQEISPEVEEEKSASSPNWVLRYTDWTTVVLTMLQIAMWILLL